MAKRLDDRNRLQLNINAADGDVLDLVQQKEQVEEQLQTQATVWNDERQDQFMLEAVTPNTDWMQPGRMV
ncbi:hypothetical protein [Paenibacillus sp. YYML68]|uniref:hypothetical protein n=1 Tax=Paenibacillus sp. YYML68 TaxID=2909250 RepID=UPI0024917909|nr:hypothetical protein [Paenibacillus sp. YYML68]